MNPMLLRPVVVVLIACTFALVSSPSFGWDSYQHQLIVQLSAWDEMRVDDAEFEEQLEKSSTTASKTWAEIVSVWVDEPDAVKKRKRQRFPWLLVPLRMGSEISAGASHDLSHRAPQAFEAAVKAGKQRDWYEAHRNLAHAFHYLQDKADLSEGVDVAPFKHGREQAVKDIANGILENLTKPETTTDDAGFQQWVASYQQGDFHSLSDVAQMIDRLRDIRRRQHEVVVKLFPMPAGRSETPELRLEILKMLAATAACQNRMIELFNEQTKVTLSVLFVLDASGSMDEKEPGAQISRFDKARNDILDAVRVHSSTTEMALIVFRNCGNVRVEQGFTREVTLIREALSGVRPSGGTPLADAVEFANDYSWDHALAPDAQQRLLLLSDGGESCGGEPVSASARLRLSRPAGRGVRQP